MTISTESPRRTLRQIIGRDGTPLPAIATSNLWVGRTGVFSRPTEGNKIVPFFSGADYFRDFVAACDAATTEICIIGWQVNWDALLAPRRRLWDVLFDAAKRKVKIHVMPWNDTNPVQTYDDQTKSALENINNRLGLSGKDKRVFVQLSSSMASRNNSYFSHHQKQVIVDRKIAYIGGIDLAYGRYDDAKFELRADAEGREVLNRYNPCIPWMQTMETASSSIRLVDPDCLTGAWDAYAGAGDVVPSNARVTSDAIAKGAWQTPYGEPPTDAVVVNKVGLGRRVERNLPAPLTLDPKRQPRMPWQDVHSRIEGPAVNDLLRNFVLRWNASGGQKLSLTDPAPVLAAKGQAHIQVLRSAPAAMVQKEYDAMAPSARGSAKRPSGTEDDIQLAMCQLIEKSRYFIYIESQFFVSAFGDQAEFAKAPLSPAAEFINAYGGGDQNKGARGVLSHSDEDSRYTFKRDGWRANVELDRSQLLRPPTNKVCEALVKRIQQTILDAARPNFHVYITLPVHPEGALSNATVAVQVYWTMQTISFGSRSLLNGIKRAIKARELRDKGDDGYMRVINNGKSTEHESIDTERCFQYVTLLNLRNWAKLGDRYVTEQIYVHSKLMIVDDLYALLGSANINDRSLLGERDSEVAVLVMDAEHSRADICGKGSPQPVRKYAHELRKGIWRKLFGITGGVRPANDLESAIEAPGSPDSWRRIQEQARRNAEAYEEAFPHVPRNTFVTEREKSVDASILPVWDEDMNAPNGAVWGKFGELSSPMPFEKKFWSETRPMGGVAALEGIKGFFSLLPVRWTRGENNRFEYPTSLVVDGNGIDSQQDEASVMTRSTESPRPLGGELA